MEPQCKGGADGYIGDGSTVVLYSPINCRMVPRAGQAVVISVFIIFRPLAGVLEPIKRLDPASIRKMLSKGGRKEIIIFLGWLIDSRRFIIELPIVKWVAWSEIISQLRTKRIVTYQELSTLISRLNHVCFIILDARNFMRNLR